MRATLALVLVLLGCGSEKPPPPRPELIETVRGFADRVCECGTDRSCVEPIRAEWDEVKRDVLKHGLTGPQLDEYTAELNRLRLCGDAAGLTIWL